jgi:hypothetical protein
MPESPAAADLAAWHRVHLMVLKLQREVGRLTPPGRGMSAAVAYRGLADTIDRGDNYARHLVDCAAAVAGVDHA